MTTFLIIGRSGSTFTVKQVEVDPHTTQGAATLQSELNALSVSGNVIMQVIACSKP